MAKKSKATKRGGGGKPKGAKGARKSKGPKAAAAPAEETAEDASEEPAAEAPSEGAEPNGHANGHAKAAAMEPHPSGFKRTYRPLPVPLTEAQRDRLRVTMHDAETGIIDLKEDRKRINEDIKSKRGERKEAALKSKAGVETVMVECLLVPSFQETCLRTIRIDLPEGDARRDHPLGMIVDTRALTREELTGDLFDKLKDQAPPTPAVDADDEEAMKRLAEQAAAASANAANGDAIAEELGPEVVDEIGEEFDDDDDASLEAEEAAEDAEADGLDDDDETTGDAEPAEQSIQ